MTQTLPFVVLTHDIDDALNWELKKARIPRDVEAYYLRLLAAYYRGRGVGVEMTMKLIKEAT